MSKLHKVKTPLYGVYIHYSSDPQTVLDYFNQEPVSNVSGFCCYNHNDRSIGVYIPHKDGALNIPALGHEVFHACMQIRDYVGLEPTLNANEEIAYLIEWLTGWILDCIDKEVKLSNKE